jgi:hypothetical protein
MKCVRALLLVPVSVSLVSCGTGDQQSPAVSKPREGGKDVDPPAGGFQAVSGQKIYVPVYSSIYTSDQPLGFNLAVTLSIRNTDSAKPIILTYVKYFDHDGKLVQDHLKKPLLIEPMAAVEFFVRERDTRGGISASFLLEWLAEDSVTPPVVESVMMATASSRGVSFTTQGRVLSDRSKPVATRSGDRP